MGDDVNTEKLKLYAKGFNFAEAKHQLVTLPVFWLVLVFAAGTVFKQQINDYFGFITRAEAGEQITKLEQKVDRIDAIQLEHIKEFRVSRAYDMVRQVKDDLDAHRAEELDTPEWKATLRRLEDKHLLAVEYKSCILNNAPNCTLMAAELWQ